MTSMKVFSFVSFCFLILSQTVNVMADSPPKSRKTTGNWECALHEPEIHSSEDFDDDKLVKLFKKCKPNAAQGEVDDSLEYLHELQSEEKKAKEKAARMITNEDMNAVSRNAVFSKHAKSYGTIDKKDNSPFVSGEWYFNFDQGKDAGWIDRSNFPNTKVMASGCARRCRWMLFFVCMFPYIESNIMVQSTAERCYTHLFFWTRCSMQNHQVYFRYWNTNPASGGSCQCKKECSRCTGH